MKSKLPNQTPAVVLLLLIVGLTMMATTPATAADNRSRANPPAHPVPPPAIDPATGLPLTSITSLWKDPAWQDPDKVLPNVVYDGLPLGEVARLLRQEFKDAFDILIPNGWQDPHSGTSIDPQNTTIKMQLKNVTASEVFNAMNLLFDTENTPCRWELKLNGNRPTAMLRILPERIPPPEPTRQPPSPKRMVYFVGDLLGTGMTMEQLVKTVSEVYQMSYGESKGVLQFHKDAQLLIVTGNSEQIAFAQQTLSALREKGRAQQKPEPKTGATKARPEETKPE